MKNKKAQIKIQQTSFVLIAVTLLFVLVGMFFLNIKISQMEEEARSLKQKEAMTLASNLANSPEFSCGGSIRGEVEGTCVDFDKVMALKKQIEQNQEYKKLWNVEGIEIKKVYPSKENKVIECKEKNYPDCNQITLIESKKPGKESYVSLCRKSDIGVYTKSKCEIGKIIVRY